MKSDSLLQEFCKQKYSFLFIAPGLVLFTIFVLIPVVASLFLSFTEYNVIQPPRWIGFGNYAKMFSSFSSDPRFWKAIRNTVVYVAGTLPVGITLSLALAVAIDQKIHFKNFFKTMFFMPAVTSVVALSVIWRWLYAGEK